MESATTMTTKSAAKVQILTATMTGKTLWHARHALAFRGNAAATRALSGRGLFGGWSVMAFKSAAERAAHIARVERLASKIGASVEMAEREPVRDAEGNAAFLVRW